MFDPLYSYLSLYILVSLWNYEAERYAVGGN
jgi:hypothetical protein